MKDPQELITGYLDDALTDSGLAGLNAWLKADDANVRQFTEALFFEQQIRAAALAREISPVTQLSSSAAPIKVDFKRQWSTQAAAWVGAFTLFRKNAAHAAGTTASSTLPKAATLVSKSILPILMTKTTTAITIAILLAGGTALFLTRNNEQQASARMAALLTEAGALRRKLELRPPGPTPADSVNPGTPSASGSVSVTALMVLYGRNPLSQKEAATMNEFENSLALMDAESIKNLVLDAEKIGGAPPRFFESLLKALTAKSPAEAAPLAARLAAEATDFNLLVSLSAEKAFQAWMETDPGAADAWYTATLAAGGFDSRSIPMNGLEDSAIDRSFARVRFATLLRTNPEEAGAMMASMPPGDVTKAMSGMTDPAVIGRIQAKLSTNQQSQAAAAAIRAMAAKDLDSAGAWASKLEMDEGQRQSLLASAVVAANAHGKLDLNGVAEWAKSLKISDQERGRVLGTAAGNSTIVNDKVVWEKVAERCGWLRQESPAALASTQVGQYLGQMALHSRELAPALLAYEHEVARQASPDPQLGIAFAQLLGIASAETYATEALKILEKLPASPERDLAIEGIQNNRR